MLIHLSFATMYRVNFIFKNYLIFLNSYSLDKLYKLGFLSYYKARELLTTVSDNYIDSKMHHPNLSLLKIERK